LSKKCHITFFEQTENSLFFNSNKLWDFVLKNRSNYVVPKIVSLGGVNSSCDQEKCKFVCYTFLLCLFFEIGYSQPAVIELLKNPFFDLPNNCYFTSNHIFLKLNGLKNVLSIGPDGIPSVFLYSIRYVIFYPLLFIFRRSLNESIFHD